MSMVDLDEALKIIAENADQAWFAGPRDETLILSAEHVLAGRLPPTYRAFVSSLGAGNFGALEVYGVIDQEFGASTVPNGVWLTLNERRENGLPSEYAIIGSSGDGGWYCVELGDQESPVFLHWAGAAPEPRQHIATDFGAFFLNGVREQI
ncbi:SMI1/KNR4 family protein [Mesorhizobium sp. IMUNJ 23232]|uniref:SMI1/KNR4 family protein n=1 Tax=Mesorhizobium sp. IMUNJ 23232 TaxID=3376064 RepID=UPI00379D60AA